MVATASLSEPAALIATVPPLSSAAVCHRRHREEAEADDVGERGDGAEIRALLVELHHRGEADMHHVELAGAHFGGATAAAAHVAERDLEVVLGVEAGVVRHPDRQHGVGGAGGADADLGRCLGEGGECSTVIISTLVASDIAFVISSLRRSACLSEAKRNRDSWVPSRIPLRSIGLQSDVTASRISSASWRRSRSCAARRARCRRHSRPDCGCRCRR